VSGCSALDGEYIKDGMPSPTAPLPTPNLQPRDRLQRARFLALTPAERLAAMQRLIDEAWAVLEQNPTGLAHFRRRNFRARAILRHLEPPANGT
jgi:hypothetical protein